jgi:predicted ATP-dependent serine protease
MPHNMRVVKLADFADEDEHIDWLVDGLLPAEGWTVLFGDEGVGKTRFSLQLLDAINDGKDFMGMATLRRRGLFVQADSSTAEWREIVRSITPRNRGYGIVDVPAHCFDDPLAVEYIRKVVEHVKPGFAVLDSLYQLTSDDINSPKISLKLNMMRACLGGIPFMLLCHPPQDGKARAAGSKAISAAASYVWQLTETQLRIMKGRLTAKGSIAITRDEKGRWVSIQDEVDAFGDMDNEPVR